MSETRTWHHGLVARWWREFGDDDGKSDVDYFYRRIAESGQPVLDAGCGTGRLLVPLREAGIDIDGSDASADMLAGCQAALDNKGMVAELYHSPMHELTPEQQYRTIICCGAFGLGVSRANDLAGLRRLHRCLEPGGTLVLDHYLPNFGRRSWDMWINEPELPTDFPAGEDRRRASDGSMFIMNSRTLDFDPLALTTTREIRIQHFDDNEALLNEESHEILINIYFKPEIELMLTSAGFTDISVTGNLEDRPALPWQDARVVFTARA